MIATIDSPTPMAQCQSCAVNFVASGRVTADDFLTRHTAVVHTPQRTQDIKNAGRSTRKKIEVLQAARALRESKRMAAQAERAAKTLAARERASAAAAKRARVRRRR